MNEIKYSYRDETGKHLYFKVRTPDKNFYYDPKLNGMERVLYNLPELLTSQEKEKRIVWITEGERDSNNLIKKCGFVAVTAGGASDWKPEFAKLFKGMDVIVCEDNDDAGKKSAEKICYSLFGHADSVHKLTFRDQQKGYDIAIF